MCSAFTRCAAAILACLLVASAATAERLEDPTRPPAAKIAAPAKSQNPASLRVQSVWLSGERRAAVIGDKRVVPGDRIAGGRVVAIELAGVHVRRPDGDLFLELAGGDPKRPAEEPKER